MSRKVRVLLAVALVLLGAAVFFFPDLAELYSQWKTRQTLASIEQMQTTQAPTAASTTPASDASAVLDDEVPAVATTTPVETEPSEMDLLYQELVAYNDKIYTEGQENLRDPFSYQTPAIDLTEYGFEENIVATIWIPRMAVELPVYLGATNENMALGAAVLGETSLPVTGENTNVVIAGHRGYGGLAMFRDIQLLQIGDKITMTTPWETLIYRVCELKIISPDDSDGILIQPGRELLTLLTCHPYTQNYQRYMVIAERSYEEQTQTRQEDLAEAERTFDDKPRSVQFRDEDGGTSVIQVEPVSIQSVGESGETGAAYSNLQILLEKYAPPVILVLLGLLVVAMLLKKRRRKQA